MNNPSDKTILIVNDSPDQRELLKNIFEQAGYNASTAADAREGFNMAKSAQFDLIISDVIMPDGDGIELCLWIRADEKLHSLPILLVSGLRKDVSNLIEGLKGGADDYSKLPADPLHLIARADWLIERKRIEDLIRQNENHFRSLIENAPDVISVILPDGTILYQSPSLEQVLGFKPELVIGENIFDLIHNDDKARVADFFEKNMKTSVSTQPIEYRFRNSGGEWLIFESVGKFINDPTKGSVAIINSRDITERRLTEKALRESEARLQAIFDNSAIGIALSNIDGFPIHSNPALQKMLGYTGRELQQMSFIELTHPIDVAKTSVFMQEIQQGTRNYYQIEKRYIKKSGEEMWSSVTVSTISKDSSEPQFVLSMIEDITNRKLAEQNIVFQAQLLNTVEQAVIATDLNGIVNYWNQFAHTLYGWSAEEAVGRSVIELTTPEIFREKGIEIMERLGTGKSWSGEFIVQNKDADIFPAQVFNTPINDDKGKLTGVVGISIDITERKQAEQGLRESEENFRALVLATAQHVWTIKENDANEDISKWWMNLTGLTFEKLQVANWLEPIHPEDREIAEAVWQNEFTNKILFNTSYRVRIKTGEYRHYAVRGVPVFNSDGSFRQWIGTFDDITEHKQIEQALLKSEEQLRQSQKLESVGRLAGGIAHDFNNMLTAINGYSDLTLRKLEADNPLRHNIEEIKKAGERSALLTRQLLAFSRRQVLQPSVLDLNEVIADTTKMLERLIGEDVRLETILGANLGHVTADPGQLTQVIMNLAVNSRDAMPKGGNLIIKTANVFLDEEYAARHVPTKPGSYIMLAVTDNGLGMNDETLKNIFEPFYTTKDIGKGTGLGLATVYGIVKQSEGFIWVESEIGAGSTFKIYLPCIDSEPDLRDKDDASEHTAHKAATILIVEDEDLVRALTRQALEECGYKIIEAGNGSQALAMCRQSDCAIDLVITDVVMPEMGGRELAEKLAETCPQMPVLFTSGYTDDATIRSDVIEADTNFIQKPFTFESLTNKVKQFLNKKTAIE